MSTLDAGLRGGGIVIFLLLAFFAWRDARHVPAARYSALLVICAAAYLVESAPALVYNDAAWLAPLRVLSISTAAVFLLWASATFDDSFRPSWRAWVPLAAMAALAIWAIAANQALPWRAVQVAVLALVGLGLWRAMIGTSADLVEGRRRFRVVLAVGVGAFMAAFTIFSALTSAPVHGYGSTLGAAIVLALGVTSALQRLGARPHSALEAEPIGARLAPAAETATVAASDPEDQKLLDRLLHLMEVERIYRQEGISIAVLAERLHLPEYRLRRLINQSLGHRNFNSFINGYRLAEAISALSDPDQAQVSVVTIALDAGFQSIGPFNRAFKARTGLTPTDFRRAALDRAKAGPAEPLPISKSA
jgi:AraC-like DNA-binding protein